MRTIHVIANTFWNTGKGMSGGDKRNLEFFKRWNDKKGYHFIVYAPKKFLDILSQEVTDLNIEYRVTSTASSEKKGVITAYMIHTARAIMQLPYFKKNRSFIQLQIFYQIAYHVLLENFLILNLNGVQ